MAKYVELNTYIKLKDLANTGGTAKILIRSGNIKVNGEVETRNKKKLYAGDIVEFKDTKFKVEEEYCKKEKEITEEKTEIEEKEKSQEE